MNREFRTLRDRRVRIVRVPFNHRNLTRMRARFELINTYNGFFTSVSGQYEGFKISSATSETVAFCFSKY